MEKDIKRHQNQFLQNSPALRQGKQPKIKYPYHAYLVLRKTDAFSTNRGLVHETVQLGRLKPKTSPHVSLRTHNSKPQIKFTLKQLQ